MAEESAICEFPPKNGGKKWKNFLKIGEKFQDREIFKSWIY